MRARCRKIFCQRTTNSITHVLANFQLKQTIPDFFLELQIFREKKIKRKYRNKKGNFFIALFQKNTYLGIIFQGDENCIFDGRCVFLYQILV